MVSHAAVSIYATQTRTWVLTLAVDAGLVRGAVRVDRALRPAVGRGADHFGQAGALATVADGSGWVGIRSTRVWLTWIHIHRFDR